MVKCSMCGRIYELTPMNDYFGATNTTDGMCEPCMMKAAGIESVEVVNPEVGEQMEAEYRAKRREN